jgi:hypothetical protein
MWVYGSVYVQMTPIKAVVDGDVDVVDRHEQYT